MAKMALQIAGQGGVLTEFGCIARIGVDSQAVLAEHWLVLWQAMRFLVVLGQCACLIFACLYIRLVEGVNADDRACHGSGNLPTEKLLADVPAVLHADARDRMAGPLEGFHRLALRGIDLPVQL